MQVYARAYGLETVCLRYFNVFGPRQDPQSEYAAVIPKFITAALAGQAAAHLRRRHAVARLLPHRQRHRGELRGGGGRRAPRVGRRVQHRLRRRRSISISVVALIGDILGRKLIEAVYEPERAGDIKHSWADIGAARARAGLPRRRCRSPTVCAAPIEWYKSQVVSLISMTGFGRASVEAGERRLRVEIRSVNHRGLDLKIRGTEPDAYCDAEIARAVRARGRARRGHRARPRRVRGAGPAGDRRGAGAGGARGARAAAAGAGDRGAGRPGDRRRVHDGRPPAARWTGEALWEALRPALDGGAGRADARRAQQEGAALAADIEAHRDRLVGAGGAACARRRRRCPSGSPAGWTERLARLRGQPGFEPGRIAQEVALMAERLDVSEELVRLETHLAPRRASWSRRAGAVGRKLDFVIQEIGRELNTIASKAQDAGVAGAGDRRQSRAGADARAGPERRVNRRSGRDLDCEW